MKGFVITSWEEENGTAIYHGGEVYSTFLMLLSEVQKRYPFILHAYCLMTDHFHLELTTKGDPIWKTIKPIMNHYERTFN